MKKGAKIALATAAVGVAALAILVLAKKAPPPPPPPPPPSGSGIKIVNLPLEANMWGCAFQDPATGEWYQPTNRPLIGSHLFDSSESAELSPPVSSGILSISAFYLVSAMDITQIVNYQVNITIVKSVSYTFDFSTGNIIK